MSSSLLTDNPFQDIEVPEELEASLLRHREHLARLVLTLRSAGVDEVGIESSVSVIIASYKQELLQAIKRMVRHGH